jgi:hypothetical protein
MPNGRLYANCFVQATESRTCRRAHDGGGDELILFTCTGAPARAFDQALGPWSARIGSEFDMDGRTARSTSKIRRNLYGADYCSARDDEPLCSHIVLAESRKLIPIWQDRAGADPALPALPGQHDRKA